MTEAARSQARDRIVVDCELDEPPAKVWRALTSPELLAVWLLPNDLKAEPGTQFRLDGDGLAVEATVLAVEPERLLALAWREADADTVVTFRLTPAVGGGTHLKLVHGPAGEVVALHRPAAAPRGPKLEVMAWAA